MERLSRIEIPTPFQMEAMNAYLLAGDEVTLIDPGPATDTARSSIKSALGNRGLNVEAIDRVLLTHAHSDHCGLTNWIVERSGAKTAAHPFSRDMLERPAVHFDRFQEVIGPVLSQHGVPPRVLQQSFDLLASFYEHQDPVSLDEEIRDGDLLQLDDTYRVIHTPGHAPDTICLVNEDDGHSFTGDHVLPHTTPNPTLAMDPESNRQRFRSLPSYLESLKSIIDQPVSGGHGGHGDPIDDVTQRSRTIIAHHEARLESLEDILSSQPQWNTFQLMQEMFSDLPDEACLLGFSEIIGHLDVLEDRGRVALDRTQSPLAYKS